MAKAIRRGRYAAGYDGAADSPNPGILKNAGDNAMMGKQVRIAMPPTPPVGNNHGQNVNAYPMFETPAYGYGGGMAMPGGGMQPGFQQIGQGTYDPNPCFQAYGNIPPMPSLSQMPFLPGGMPQGMEPVYGPHGYGPPRNFQAQQGMQAFPLAGQPQYQQTGPAAGPAHTMFNTGHPPPQTFSDFQKKEQAGKAGQVARAGETHTARAKRLDAERQARNKNSTLDHFADKNKNAEFEAQWGSELPKDHAQRDPAEEERKKVDEEWRKRKRGNDWQQGNNANRAQDAQKMGGDRGGKKDGNAWYANDAAGAWNNQNEQKNNSDRGRNDKKDSDGWGGTGGGWDKQPSANNGGNNTWSKDQNAQQGAGDWKESKPSSNKGDWKQNNGWGGDNDQKQDAGSWGTPAADQKNGDDKWGGSQNSKSNNGGGSWDKKSDSNDKQSNQGWGNNDKSDDKQGGWGDDDAKSRHSASSTKSTKSHHRRSGSISSSQDAKSHIKPYFKEWNQPFDKIIEGSESDASSTYAAGREVYHYPADPLPPVPANKAKSASHGVQTGMGTDYAHLTRRPAYLDSMEKPYAVFSFKYRSPEALSKICGATISTADLEKRVEKDLLLTLPKHKLVEELMAKRGVSAPGKTRGGESRKGSGGGNEKGAGKEQGGWGAASAAGGGSGGGGGW